MTLESEEIWKICHIISCCAIWYSASSVGNILTKTILNEFPFPMTISMTQFSCLSIFLPIALNFFRIPRLPRDIDWNYYMHVIVPLAAGKFFASVSSHISVWKVPVSYAHTVKTTMPLFTVLISRAIFKEKQSNRIYFTLLIIVTGVGIATTTELSFNALGLVSAVVSTLAFAFMNIFSKHCMRDTGVHHLRLLCTLSQLSAAMMLPIWLIVDFRRIIKDDSLFQHKTPLQSLVLLVGDGCCNVLQNIMAFTLISMVTSLSYAVCNASKRIAVIILSLITLRNPVTPINIVGMGTAIAGVLAYNKAKLDQMRAKRREVILPLVKSEPDLSHLGNRPEHLHHSNTLMSLSELDQSPWPGQQRDNPLLNNGAVYHTPDESYTILPLTDSFKPPRYV